MLTYQDQKALELLRKKQSEIEENFNHLRDSFAYTRSEVLKHIKIYNDNNVQSPIKISEAQLRYIIQNNLVPVKKDEVTNNFLFNKQGIIDIVLIRTIRQYPLDKKKKIPLLKIKKYLDDIHGSAVSIKNEDNKHHSRVSSDVGVPQTQIERGKKYFNSRILDALLLLLLPEQKDRLNFFLLRRTRVPEKLIEYDHTYEFLEIPQIDTLFKDIKFGEDIIGDIKPDGEILLPDELSSGKNIIHMGYQNWYYFSIYSSEKQMCQYEFAIAAPEVTNAEKLFKAPTSLDDCKLITLLMEACFIDVEKVHSPENTNEILFGEQKLTTAVEVILSIIPELHHQWDYCNVLVPLDEYKNQLKVLSQSAYYPSDLPHHNLVIENGQLIAGWAFKHSKPIIVQSSGTMNDPRFRMDPISSAAIAVPTWVDQSIPNGVLYVGSRNENANKHNQFPQHTQKFLWLVGGILGELLERDKMRTEREISVRTLLEDEGVVIFSWASFSKDIEKIAKKISSQKSKEFSTHENLYIFVSRISQYKELFDYAPYIATWLMDHLISTTYYHFIQRGFNPPNVYKYSEMEFICLLEQVSISDDGDRVFRDDLRKILNSISLPFSHTETIVPNVFVWTIPYKYSNMFQDIEKIGLSKTTIQLLGNTERAINTLQYREEAHMYEKQGAYHKAYKSFLLADQENPGDAYNLRHISKYLLYINDYERADEYADQVVQIKDHPSHLRRRAVTKMCTNQYEEAKEDIKNAVEKAPNDLKCRLVYGQILYFLGEYKSAIDQFLEVEKLGAENTSLIYRLIAQAALASKDPQLAENFIGGIAANHQDNPDVLNLRWLMCREIRKTNKVSS